MTKEELEYIDSMSNQIVKEYNMKELNMRSGEDCTKCPCYDRETKKCTEKGSPNYGKPVDSTNWCIYFD